MGRSIVENQSNLIPESKTSPAKRGFLSRLLYIYRPRTWKEKGALWTLGVVLATYVVIVVILGIYWSWEPDFFDVRTSVLEKAGNDEKKLVPGFATTATAIRIAETLLHKPGGYLSNDVTPPGIYLDNMPAWEFGVLTELRDTANAMRNHFSRSRTQSIENKDVQQVESSFNFDPKSWILPSTESQYENGIQALYLYLQQLADEKAQDQQFFTRADNLTIYLNLAAQRLGSLAQRLAASVGQERVDINLAGDPKAPQSTPTSGQQRVRTAWLEIDNVFYEARGYTWALTNMLKAISIDFENVLKDKNVQSLMEQTIRELEGANSGMWIPMVLNGTGFGLLANHSLVMASYISRANAGLIDIVKLLATN